jgi:hypothetical protein
LIDFVDLDERALTLGLISKLSRTRRRGGCCDPRNAASCATDL